MNNTLKADTANEEGNEFLLFCDNLSSQANEKFLVIIRAINGVVWFGVSGATDIWQPKHCGIGQMLKQIVSVVNSEETSQKRNACALECSGLTH